jgi:hypothetical protein
MSLFYLRVKLAWALLTSSADSELVTWDGLSMAWYFNTKISQLNLMLTATILLGSVPTVGTQYCWCIKLGVLVLIRTVLRHADAAQQPTILSPRTDLHLSLLLAGYNSQKHRCGSYVLERGGSAHNPALHRTPTAL